MSGMPVECHAVVTSPSGTVIAGRGPSPKSTARVCHAGATGVRTPLRRTRAGSPRLSIAVMAVPREIRPEPPYARVRRHAPGSLSFRCTARQSEGTTSKPAPGRSITPRSRASASRAASASKTATSPVMSR